MWGAGLHLAFKEAPRASSPLDCCCHQVTLIEADQLLGSFDARLREYAARKLVAAGVHLTRGIVKEVRGPGKV